MRYQLVTLPAQGVQEADIREVVVRDAKEI